MLFLLAAKDSSSDYSWVVWLIVIAIGWIAKFVSYQKQQAADAAVRAERAEKYKNRKQVVTPVPLEKAIQPAQVKIHRHAPEHEFVSPEAGKPVWQQEQEFAFAPVEVLPPLPPEAPVAPTIVLNDAEQSALAALQHREKLLDRTEAKKVSSHKQSSLLTILRDPASLRAAIIYREIISEPVALRKARTM